MLRRLGMASLITLLSLPGCQPASYHAQQTRKGMEADERLTVGTVQRKIQVGMAGAEVAQVLGSPNIVTTDEKRREVWVYDKISTERVVSSHEGGAGIPFLIFFSSEAGAKSTSQRTLTVIIKFDEGKKVRDFAYHTSRF